MKGPRNVVAKDSVVLGRTDISFKLHLIATDAERSISNEGVLGRAGGYSERKSG